MRLDRFLAGALPDLSRSRLQALLAAGAVRRAGETIRDGNTRVKPDEVYDIVVPPPAPAIPQAQVESLNAGVAGSVALYEAQRQRSASR